MTPDEEFLSQDEIAELIERETGVHELLAALKEITPSFNTTRIIMQDQEARALAGEIVKRARAAIAKATANSK